MKDYVKANKETFNALAEEYLKRSRKKGKYEEPLDNLVGIPLGFARERFQSVHTLELGPGSGEICAYLAKKGCDTTALDLAEKILEVVGKLSPSTKLINADILEFGLPKEGYEMVYCGAFIHLFKKEDAKIVMQNIWESLKQKGILLIYTTIHEESAEGFFAKQDYSSNLVRFRHRYTEPEFKELIESSGFIILERMFTDEKDRNKKWVTFVCEKA